LVVLADQAPLSLEKTIGLPTLLVPLKHGVLIHNKKKKKNKNHQIIKYKEKIKESKQKNLFGRVFFTLGPSRRRKN